MLEPKITSDLDVFINKENLLEQVLKFVHSWQDAMSGFFNEFEEAATCFRMIESNNGNRPATFTKTRVGETIRSTEALTTSMFRMMTSADPCYDLVSMNGTQTAEQVFASSLQLRYQDHVLKWKPKLLRATRGVTLFGTQPIETPWIRRQRFGQLQWEGLGFVPRSMLQFVFDPYCLSMEDTPRIAFIDYFTEDHLRDLAMEDPEHWNPAQIEKAITETSGSGSGSSWLQSRRMRSGYRETPNYEVITYYGRLRDIPREDGRHWVLRVINEKVVVAAYPNPSPTGDLPFLVSHFLQFELESLGYGVYRLGKIPQKHMDDNRRQYMDIARLALMNMWLKDRMSGVKNSDLKIKPLGIIEADDINLLKQLVPNLEAVQLGFKMEEMYRAEFQGNTGATQGLQAQVTDASATEASIAQNEAIRRVSVTAEQIAESFVRDYQMQKHEYNIRWLEKDQWLAVSGMDKPIKVNRRTMAPFVDIYARVTTDKDFRPKRIDNILKALQGLTSIRNRPNIRVDDLELVKELMGALDINPAKVIRDENNLAPTSVLSFLAANANAAKQAAQELGPEADAKLNEAGVGGVNTVDTPAGAVMVSQ